MKDKYVVIDLRDMGYFRNDEGDLKLFETQEEAFLTCGIYELENVWVCKLIGNHIEQ